MTTVTRGDEKREQIITFIRQFAADRGMAPTLMEIADGVQLKSASNVRTHLMQLQADGRVTIDRGKFRTIRLVGE